MKLIRGSFLAGSLVNQFNFTKVSIEWLKPGSKVFTSDLELLEFYEEDVIQTCSSITDFYYLINNFGCLDNHYFFCTDNYKWLKPCDLIIGSNILSINGSSEKVIKIDIIFKEVKVYNICTEGTGYFFVNGILVKPILGDIML